MRNKRQRSSTLYGKLGLSVRIHGDGVGGGVENHWCLV